MRLPSVAVLLVACTFVPRSADAKDPVRHEGKSLTDWIAQAEGRSDDKALEAIVALKRARFLVGASDLVVPALVGLAGAHSRQRFSAVAVLGAYGPLARSALDDLGPLESESSLGLVVARIRIGHDVEVGLRRWRDEAEKRLAHADRVLGRRSQSRNFEFGVADHQATTGLFEPLTAGGELGLRGEGVAHYAQTVLRRSYGHLIASSVLWCADDLGAAAAPLAGDLVSFLADPEPAHRERALGALAWIPELPPETVKRMLKAAPKVTRLVPLRRIVRGLALTAHEPAGETASALKTWSTHADRQVAAWAVAGLARRGVEFERLQPVLRKNLDHADPEIRVAGADGLLSLGRTTPEVSKAVEARLSDPDLRVRWRCGALVVREGGDRDAAFAGLALALDGPDDVERVAVLELVRSLGPAAAPIRETVAAWASVPLPRLAEPARMALKSIDGK